MASYDWLTNKYGEGSVYIATSAVQDPETSPFDYADKVKMMTKLGVPASHIVKVKNPYRAEEIVNSLSDEERANTALIFAVSAKDNQRFSFAPKKNGDPSYLQSMPESNKKLQPMTKHGYVAVTPTVNFQVKGQDADSASAIRKLYRDGNDSDRDQIITDLYGTPDPELRAIFDQRLGVDAPQEGIIYGQEAVFAGDNPVNIMREHKLARIQENIQWLKNKIKTIKDGQDYIDERKARKK
jgi:hypothetical protein